jgi:SPP1 family predicted phage head-tail adaptor
MPSTGICELDAGKLDRRVVLLKPVYTSEYQDEIQGYVPVTEVWAAIEPTTGQEMNTGGRTVEIVMATIQIRYRTDIDARWRISDRGTVYQIKGMMDVLKRRVQWQLNCVEVE